MDCRGAHVPLKHSQLHRSIEAWGHTLRALEWRDWIQSDSLLRQAMQGPWSGVESAGDSSQGTHPGTVWCAVTVALTFAVYRGVSRW